MDTTSSSAEFDRFAPYPRDYSMALLRRMLSADNNFLECYIINPGTEKDIVKRIYNQAKKHGNKKLICFLSVKGSTPQYRHAAALVINPSDKSIIYQNPKGTKIDTLFARELQKVFKDYNFFDLQITQQSDDNNCAVFTVDNLKKLAKSQEIDSNPDPAKLREEHNKILENRPQGKQLGTRSGKKFRIK